jgi:hypothetical protein
MTPACSCADSGVALNAAHIEILHAMRASFDIDFYVNVNVDVEDE